MERASARIKKKLASGVFPVPSSALGVTGVFPVPEFGVAGADTRLQPATKIEKIGIERACCNRR